MRVIGGVYHNYEPVDSDSTNYVHEDIERGYLELSKNVSNGKYELFASEVGILEGSTIIFTKRDLIDLYNHLHKLIYS